MKKVFIANNVNKLKQSTLTIMIRAWFSGNQYSGSGIEFDISVILSTFKRQIHQKNHLRMKKTMVTAALALAFTLGAIDQVSYQELDEGQIVQTELRQAISLAEKLLLGQKSGEIYILSEEEAIPEVAKGLTEGVQVSSYENISSMFGDYESMQFAEALTMKTDQSYTLYRFKGTFSETSEKPEIRVVLNKEGKLAGFWIRPWQDDLEGQP